MIFTSSSSSLILAEILKRSVPWVLLGFVNILRVDSLADAFDSFEYVENAWLIIKFNWNYNYHWVRQIH